MQKAENKYNEISYDLEVVFKVNTHGGEVLLYHLHNLDLYSKKYKKKMLEKIIKDLIIQSIFNDSVELVNNSIGAPFLIGNTNKLVSISHSGSYFAFYFSENSTVGIDVEQNRSLKETNQDYIINDQEKQTNWSNTEKLIIWCAKETFYKMKLGTVKDLKNVVTIENIMEDAIILQYEKEEHVFGLIRNEGYILVYSHPFE